MILVVRSRAVGVLGFVARSDWRYLVAHAQEAGDRGLELGGPGLGLGVPGVGHGQVPDAGNYYMAAAERGEPAGVWFGPGVGLLGYAEGQSVSARAMEAVYGRLVNPRTGELLGSRPRRYAGFEERLAKFEAAERAAVGGPLTAERCEELRFAASKDQREACHYYDLTYSPEKSWSVLYAGLRAAGLDREAETLWGCLEDAYKAGLAEAMGQACYARTGTHAGRVADRSFGRWQASSEWVASLWRHHTSRAGDPQLHIHGAVLNRVRVDTADGPAWYALDGTAVKNVRRAAAATMSRTAEALAAQRLGLSFTPRVDGKGREITGVDERLIEAFSTRRRAIEDEAAKLSAAYREGYGRDPSAYELRLFSEQATLATRARKPEHAPTEPELLAVWEATVRDRLAGELGDVPAAAQVRPLDTPSTARVFEVDPGLQGEAWLAQVLPDAGARALLVEQALADVGGRLTTWTRADVKAALDAHLPTTTLTELPAAVQGRLLEELADLALAHPDAARLSVDPLLDAPAVWRRPGDGRGLHQPPAAYDRYTHTATLGREAALVEAATAHGYPGLALDAVEGQLAATTLRPSQRDAVARVLSSGRAVDLVIGPAGTGKSYTLAELARIWTGPAPGPSGADGPAARPRVLGLATSEAAVRVLREEGITRCLNVTAFLVQHDRVLSGDSIDPADQELVTLGAGDLVILDEASMTSTEDVAQVLAAVRGAGAKLVLAGDDRQLGAVEAGGVFSLLAERMRPVVLDEVVRFHNAWEGPASLRLRDGDATAIREYDRRGRILAGAKDELLAAARRGFVADHLTGRTSLVITPTNEAAAEVASHIRAELVALGRVEPAGVVLHNATRAGVGDLVATRHNDRSLDDGCGGWVANRDTWAVIGRGGDGSLVVRRDLGPDDTGTHHWGPEVALPAAYVAEHVELAYAATVHAAQGRTTDTCYPIVDEAMSADALYVALTRARERTLIGVATAPEPVDGLGPQDVERAQTTPEAVLARIIERPREHASATQTLTAHVDARESLTRLGPEWADLITRDAHTRYTARLQELLGAQRWAEVRQDPAFGALLRAIRASEIAGRDVELLLSRAVGRHQLDTATSIAQVLHYRITADTPGQDTERADGASFLRRTPDLVDPQLDCYAKAIAAAMDERIQVLGERAAAEAPGWAVAALGPVPDEVVERAEWTRRAGVIAGYREQHGWVHASEAIGPAPHRSAAEARADWHRAWTALGRPDEQRDLAAATRGELANLVQAWERAHAAAPPNVDEQLWDAHRVADFCDREARYLHAQAAAGTPGLSGQDPAELAAHAAEFRRHEAAARARVADLEEAAARRTAWYEATGEARRAAQLAGAELERRAGRPDPAVPAGPGEPGRVPVPVGGAEVDREAVQVRQREVLARLQTTWAEHARASAELQRAAAALEQARAAAADRAAENAALAPLREQREAARAALAAAEQAAQAAQARLDEHAAQTRQRLQQRWEQDKAAIAEAARVVEAGPGRFGWGARGVRAAEQELHQWAQAWRPLVGHLATDDPRALASYARRHPANDATAAPFDAHAKAQAARDLAEDAARVRAAEAARHADAEALRRYGEEAARLRQAVRPHPYGGRPAQLASVEHAHTRAEQRVQRLSARIEDLAADPALNGMPDRDSALARARERGTSDYHDQLRTEWAAAIERAAAQRAASPDYDLHHDYDHGIDRGGYGIDL